MAGWFFIAVLAFIFLWGCWSLAVLTWQFLFPPGNRRPAPPPRPVRIAGLYKPPPHRLEIDIEIQFRPGKKRE